MNSDKTVTTKSHFHKIKYFYFATLLETTILAIAIKLNGRVPDKIDDFSGIFANVVLEFVYVTDAIMAKNIYQVQNFPRMVIYTIILITLEVYQFMSTRISLFLVIALLGFQVLEILLICFWIKDLRKNFDWFTYRSKGLSVELQECYKIRQKVLVYYKIDIITSTSLQFVSRNYINFDRVLKLLSFLILLGCIFVFIAGYNTENRITRGILISLYFLKISIGTLELIDFGFNPFLSYVFIPISLVYTIFNDTFLVIYLIADCKNFGKGLIPSLNQNQQAKCTSIHEEE